MRQQVEHALEKKYSPEQIAGRRLGFRKPDELIGPLLQGIARLEHEVAGACTRGISGRDVATAGLVMVVFVFPLHAVSTVLALLSRDVGAATALVLVAPAVAVALVRPLLAVMLGVSVVRAVIGGLYQLIGTPGWSDAEGIAALILAAIAVYNATAFLLEDARQHPVLPTARLGSARRALHGDVTEQLGRTPDEAGIRQQLEVIERRQPTSQ